ncbi:conserved protein, unknown function [Hepatocystis sp. ex Piliocolobus tephrosceles]|nr:conserved protein, unknown function [Hepatocystis sp. ex Piliocolobus tephrosceles]
MNFHVSNLLSVFIKCVFILLLIRVNGHRTRTHDSSGKVNLVENTLRSIPYNNVIRYLFNKTIILENLKIKTIEPLENKCVESIRKYIHVDTTTEKKITFNYETIKLKSNENNLYKHTKEMIKQYEDDLCQYVLHFDLLLTKDMCEFYSYHNYAINLKSTRITKIFEIVSALRKKSIFITIIEEKDLINDAIIHIKKKDYYILNGTFDDDILTLDITKFIREKICNIYIPPDNDSSEIYEHDKNKKVDIKPKSFKLALFGTHKLSEGFFALSFDSKKEYIQGENQMKSYLDIKKRIDDKYVWWDSWSPCYNLCADKMAYQCRRNACDDDSVELCDRYLFMEFRECIPTACSVNLEDEDKLIKEAMFREHVNIDLNNTDRGYFHEVNKKGEHIKTKVTFVGWIRANQNLVLGIVIFIVSMIMILGLYTFFKVTMNLDEDENFVIGKYA